MKKFTLLTLIGMMGITLGSFAQQSVGVGTNAPNTSAILDVTSITKGMLIPRMTTAQKSAIVNPATGLLVFQTDGTAGVYYNSGTPATPVWSLLQPVGTAWNLTGNSKTDSLGNYIGTSDQKPLVFGVNGSYAGQIGSTGLIAIGRGAVGTQRTAVPGIIAIGDSALFSNTDDSSNIAIGNNALYSNDGAGNNNNNLAIGNLALLSNTTGAENVAIGHLASALSDTAYDNTVIGYQAFLSGLRSQNTAVGAYALNTDSIGNDNTAVGYATLATNFAGNLNTAVGSLSLLSNVNGFANTAVGYLTMIDNTNGSYNNAIGWQALASNTTGTRNNAMGNNSMLNNLTGSYNTAIGRASMVAATAASGNVAVGNMALSGITTGNFNTALGDSAFYTATAVSNSTGIGYQANVTASNQVRIGNASVTSIGGFTGWTNLSDGRYKKDVQEDVKGLDFILALRPVTYHFDFEKINADNYTNSGTGINGDQTKNLSLNSSRIGMIGARNVKNNAATKRGFAINTNYSNVNATNSNIGSVTDPALQSYYDEVKKNQTIRYTGFIAQEVENVANKLGFDFSGVDKPKNDKDHYGLRYAEFVVPLVKAVQEQQSIIQSQNQKIEELTKRLEKLEQKN